MPACPTGFTSFINTCIEIPTTLPESDFETAASNTGCFADGKQILQPRGFLLAEALKYYFMNIGLTSSFWIGKWTDIENDPYHVQVEWAKNGKDVSGDCVLADVNDGFKWTRGDCSKSAAYLCQVLSPNCPNGYTFLPKAGKSSCFKITEETGYEEGFLMYPSISTANKMCLADGTSLSAPDSKEEIVAVWDWITYKNGVASLSRDYYNAFMGLRSFTERLTIPPSCSSCQWQDHYYSPWTKNTPITDVSTSIGVLIGATDQSCTYIQRGQASGALRNTMCYNSEAATSPPTRAICEYRECRISDTESCVFPFRVGGRLYDKCTTVGTEKKTAWCSVETDENHNHIPGREATCPADCLASDCPVGFWPHLGTCIQDSSSFPTDAQESIPAAEGVCMSQGARLYQPRSTRSIAALAKRTQQFYDKTYKIGQAGWNGILGWSTTQETAIGITMEYISSGYKLLYRDGSIVPKGLTKDLSGLEWKTGYPIMNDSMPCVNFAEKGYLINNGCDGYSGDETPNLSYVCEAKPFTTIDGDDAFKACHFPFKKTAESDWSHSCVYDKKSGAPKVWCATEVDANGVVKKGKTGICEDERNTAYAGPGNILSHLLFADIDYTSGADMTCKLPFFHEGIWYENCTLYPRDWHWCPTEVDPKNRTQIGDDSYGYCPDHLIPSSEECSENYDRVGDICIRVSPYPLSWLDAENQCVKEGGHLLHILEEKVQVELEFLLRSKLRSKPHFTVEKWTTGLSVSAENIWIGGAVSFHIYF